MKFVKWEYLKREGNLSATELHKLGELGWELVTVVTGTVYELRTYEYIFKRTLKK